MNLEGTWTFTQKWNGVEPYDFNATFGKDGTITVDGGYFGTWDVLGNLTQVSLAIANCTHQVITAYNGYVVGPAMCGEMTGNTPRGTFRGTWSALQTAYAEAPKGALRPPGE